jgi:hypothetical protein
MFIYIVHLIPLTAFWSLIYFGKDDLQPRAIIVFIFLWSAALSTVFLMHLPSPSFAAVEAVLDIVLVLMVFSGDMKIR